MTALQPPRFGTERPDLRYFTAFVLLLGGLAAAALLYDVKVLALAAAGVAGGLVLVLLLIHPWIVVPAIVATTALDITGQLIKKTALGIPVTGFHLSLLLMFTGLFVNTFIRKRTVFPEFELKGPLLLFLGIMAISLIYSPNQPEATIGFVRTVFLVVFLYGAQVLIESRAAVHMVVVSMVGAVIGGSVLGVVQIVTEKFYLPASFVIAVGANAPRATGTFHNPNTFGTFLMCGVIFIFALLFCYPTARWKQALLVLALGMGITGLVVTFSRANWLAALIGIFFVLYRVRKLKYIFIFAVSGFFGVLAVKEFVPFAEHIFQRFLSIFTLFEQFGSAGRASSSARVFFAIAGIEMFLDHPLLGAGWRAFPVLFDAYKSPDFPHWVPTKESHTLFANILAEVGLLGFLAASWIVGRTLHSGFTGLKTLKDDYLKAVLTGLIAVFIGFQVSLSFTADFSNNFLWFFTGMIFAVLRLGRTQGTQAA